jgi:hypothetical protein
MFGKKAKRCLTWVVFWFQKRGMTRLDAVRALLSTVQGIRKSADTEVAAEILPVELRLCRREKALARGVKAGRKPAGDKMRVSA